MSAAPLTIDARTRILDVAEALVQERGFNAISYADVATQLGVTKPAVHYHFASKAALGAALIERYRENFAAALAALDDERLSPPVALARYADLFQQVLVRDRLCLCGMLAAEIATLPEPMRASVRGFFDDSEMWLTGVVERGRADGSLRVTATPATHARTLLGAFEGAMLVARAHGDPARFAAVAESVLASLRP